MAWSLNQQGDMQTTVKQTYQPDLRAKSPEFRLEGRFLFRLLQSLMVLFCFLTVPFGASNQFLEFTGFVTHPSEGPYNQDIHVRLEIIRKNFSIQDEENAETVVWEKTFSPVTVFNGTFSLLLDVSDSGLPINSEIFESNVDYEFDPESYPGRISQAIFPQGSYAIRLFMRRSLGADEERIKPDFNFDGSPFSVSSIPLSGDSKKSGHLTIQSYPEAGETPKAVVKVDPFTGTLLNPRHGVYIENGNLEIQTSDSTAESIQMEGAFFLRNVRITTGSITVSDGDIRANTLCMTKNCDAANPVFNSPIFSYGPVEIRQFLDRDLPFEGSEPYLLAPAGQSRIAALHLNSKGGGSGPMLSLTGASKLSLFDQASMVLSGAEARISVGEGALKLDVPQILKTLGSDRLFRLNVLRELGESTAEREDYRQAQFHKIIADRFYSSQTNETGEVVAGAYNFKPSGNSNVMALQFHFEDTQEAMEIINNRIRAKYPDNPDRLLKVIFDPVLTGDMITQMLQGDQGTTLNFFDLHQHDIIGQATALQILEIINDPRFNDGAQIIADKVSEDLIKEIIPDQSWLGQVRFMDNDDEDSLFVRGNMNILYDSYPIILGGNGLEPKPFLGAVTPLTGSPRSIYFQKDGSGTTSNWLNLKMQDLVLSSNLNILGKDGLKRNLTAHGELDVAGPFDVLQNFRLQGRMITGCQDDICQNTTVLNLPSIITASEVDNLTEISAGVFRNSLSDFYSTPRTTTRLLNLVLNSLDLSGPGQIVNFNSGLHIGSGVTIQGDAVVANSLTTNLVEANRYLSWNPSYSSDPENTSYWNSVVISGALNIQGKVSVEGDIDIQGSITASSADISQDARAGQSIYADRFEDSNGDPEGLSRLMVLNPDSLSRFNHLTASGNLTLGGHVNVRQNLTVGTLTTIGNQLNHPAVLTAERFTDRDNRAYNSDPSGLSMLRELKVESMLETSLLTGVNPQIGGELQVSRGSEFSASGTFHGGMKSTTGLLQLSDDGHRLFEVDQQGIIYANTAEIVGNSGVNRGEISGSVTVGRTATFLPEAFISNSKVTVFQLFTMEGAGGTGLLTMDAAGNISVAQNTDITGTLDFENSSVQGYISSTNWEIGAMNPTAAWLSLKRASGTPLNLAATQANVSQTGSLAHPLEFSSPATLNQFLDFEDSRFTLLPSELSVLNQVAARSSQIVTVPVDPVLASWFGDRERSEYHLDPSAFSRLQDLNTSDRTRFFSSMSIRAVTGSTGVYSARLELGATTSPNLPALDAGSYFSLSRAADLSSSLDVLHQGPLVLHDSQLILGPAGSTIAVNQTTMSTLVVLPPLTYDPLTASSQPFWYADHLHQHESFDRIRWDQIARRDIDNRFEESVRFAANADAILLNPASVISSAWTSTTTGPSDRSSAYAFTLNGGIFLGGGKTDLGTSPDSWLRLIPSGPSLANTGTDPVLAKPFGAYSASEGFLLFAGGVNANTLSSQALGFRLSDLNPLNLSLPYGMAALESVGIDNFHYLFGGFTAGTYGPVPFATSLRWDRSGLSPSLSATPTSLPQESKSLAATAYVSANRFYLKREGIEDTLILDPGTTVSDFSISHDGYHLCFTDASHQLHIYHLPTGIHTNSGSLLSPAHSCRLDPSNSQTVTYIQTQANQTGSLVSARVNGSSVTALPNSSTIAGLSLKIAPDGRVAMTGEAIFSNEAERSVIVDLAGNVNAVDGSLLAAQSTLLAGANADSIHQQGGRIYFSSSDFSTNQKRNLHATDLDGNAPRQLTYLPSGYLNNAVLLNSQTAIVATSAATEVLSHLPLDTEQGCVIPRGEKAWIFGAGGNRILVYDTRMDRYRLLGETITTGTPLSCSYDGSNRVYLRAQNRFEAYEFDRGRMVPLQGPATTVAGGLAASGNSVWLLETSTGPASVLWQYNPGTDSWSQDATMTGRYHDPAVAIFNNQLFVTGSQTGEPARKRTLPAGGWTSFNAPASLNINSNQMHAGRFFSDGSRLYLGGGFDGSQATGEIFRLNATEDDWERFDGFSSPIYGAGIFTLNGQAMAFGGLSNNSRLVMAPLKTTNDHVKLWNINLASLKKTALTTANGFLHGCSSGNGTYSWFLNQSGQIVRLNNTTGTQITIFTDALPAESLSCSSNWVWFSHQSAAGGSFLKRIRGDGSQLQTDVHSLIEGPDLSIGGTDKIEVSYVNAAEDVVYFLLTQSGPSRRLFRSRLDSLLNPVEITSTSIQDAAYLKPATISEKRVGLLFTAQNTGLADLEKHAFEGLNLNDAYPSSHQGSYLLGRDKSGEFNLYHWIQGGSQVQKLTAYSLPDKVEEILGEESGQPVFRATLGGVSQILTYGASASTLLTQAPLAFYGPVASPANLRRHTFNHANRIYVVRHSQIYRSQILNPAGDDPVFSLYDTQPVLARGTWQITQEDNSIWMYKEEDRTLARYEPEDQSLHIVGRSPTATPGTLAVSGGNAYIIENAGISRISNLNGLQGEDTLVVYSSAESNVESNPIRLFATQAEGQVYARRMAGNAQLLDGTLPGGKGNLGIEDQTLTAADFAASSITHDKIAPSTIESRHLANASVQGIHFQSNSLDGSLFADKSLGASQIATYTISENRIAASNLEASRLAALTLTSADFAEEGILEENLAALGIDSLAIQTAAIDSRVVSDNTLVLEDFGADSIASKQILDLSIQDIDIATRTLLERHFQTGSILTRSLQLNSITSDDIARGTLDTARFAENTIETQDITTGTITGELFVTGAVDSSKVDDDDQGIATMNLADNSVTLAKLATASLDHHKVDTDAVESQDIADLSLGAREFGPESIDSPNVLDNSILNASLRWDALTIDKLANLSIGTVDIRDKSIINRHFSQGGMGVLTILTDAMFGNYRAAFGLYENDLFVLPEGSASFQIDLGNRTKSALGAGFAGSLSAYAQSPTTLYILQTSGELLALDFNTRKIILKSTYPAPGDLTNRMSGLYESSRVSFMGANPGKTHRVTYDVNADSWSSSDLGFPVLASYPAKSGGAHYLFTYSGGNTVVLSTTDGISFDSTVLTTTINLSGSQAIGYNSKVYIFGGNEAPSRVYEFDPLTYAVSRLFSTSFQVDFSAGITDSFHYWQGRFYGSNHLDSYSLSLWHPGLDASVSARNLRSNSVDTANVRTNSLATINFALDSIDSARVQNLSLISSDIETNSILSRSVADSSLASSHIIPLAVTEAKIAAQAVDSRVIVDQSLLDQDFAANSIDQRTLANDSIGHEEVVSFTLISSRIQDEAITLSKVQANAVSGTDIRDNQIQTVDLANLNLIGLDIGGSQLETRHILDGNILSTHLGNLSVSREKIVTHTLLDDVIANEAIAATTQIEDATLLDEDFVTETIALGAFSSAIADRITTSKFQSLSLTEEDFATEAVREVDYADSAIAANLIEAESMLDRSLAQNSVLTQHIALSTLTESAFASDVISRGSIASLSLSNANFDLDSVLGIHLISYTLESSSFAPLAVGAEIATDAITSTRFMTGSVLNEDIADTQIASSQIANGNILSTQILDLTLNQIKFGDEVIHTRKLRPYHLRNEDFSASSVLASMFASKSLYGELIATGAMDGSRFLISSLEGIAFGDASIRTQELADLGIHGQAIGQYQIETASVMNLGILSETMSDLIVSDGTKLAATDVFGSDSFVNQSIRGSSIVSYTLDHIQLANDAIRTDLMQAGIINALYEQSAPSATLNRAVTAAASPAGLRKVQAMAENLYFAIEHAATALLQSSDGLNYSAAGPSCPSGTLFSFSMISSKSGYLGCNESLYFFDGLSSTAVRVSTATTVNTHIQDMHFWDPHHGIFLFGETDATSKTHLYTTTNGGSTFVNQNRVHEYYTSLAVHGRSAALGWTAPVYGDGNGPGAVILTENKGLSFSVHPVSASSNVLDTFFDPATGKLIAMVGEMASPAANHALYELNSGIYSRISPVLPHDIDGQMLQPWSPGVVVGREAVFFDANTSSQLNGVIAFNLDAGTYRQISPLFFAATAAHEVPNQNILLRPVPLNQNEVLMGDGNGNAFSWKIDAYTHIKPQSLQNASLADSALTSGNFLTHSVSGDRFGATTITAAKFASSGISQGEPQIRLKVASSGLGFIKGDPAGEVILAISDDKLQARVSYDQAASFANSSGYTADTQLKNCHTQGLGAICGHAQSSGKILISTDRGSNFSWITTSPFDRRPSAVWAFDSQNFLAVGVLSDGASIVPARYIPATQSFERLRTSATGDVTISSCFNANPKDLYFLDGQNGYLTIDCNTPGNSAFKTGDGGYSWTAINPANASESDLFVLDFQNIWISYDNALYSYDGSNHNLLNNSFPDDVRAMFFLSPQIGFVATRGTNAPYFTWDGGSSFVQFSTIPETIAGFTPSGNGQVLALGITSADIYEIQLRHQHQPFSSLSSVAFSPSSSLHSRQIRPQGFAATSLEDKALGSQSIANRSISRDKVADLAVGREAIQTRGLLEASFAYQSIDATKLATDGISGSLLKTKILTTGNFEDGSITSRELASGVLMIGALGEAPITTEKLKDGDITGRALVDEAILTEHIIPATLDGQIFANGVFSGSRFQEHQIDNTRFQAPFNLENIRIARYSLAQADFTGTLNSRTLQDFSIWTPLFPAGNIPESKLSPASIVTPALAFKGIDNSILGSGIITSSRIDSNAVSGWHFRPDEINRDRFKALTGQISQTQLALATFTAREIGTDAIISGKFSSTAGQLLTRSRFADGAVSSVALNGNLLGEDKFLTDAFSGNKIQENRLDSSHIAANTILTTHFALQMLQDADFASSSILTRHLASGEDFFLHLDNPAVGQKQFKIETLTGSNFQASSLNRALAGQDSLFTGNFKSSQNASVLALGAVSSEGLALNTLLSDRFANQSFQGSSFQAESLNSRVIADNFLTSSQTSGMNLTSGKIAVGTIEFADFDPITRITSDRIQPNSFTGQEFVDGFLTLGNFALTEIPNSKLANTSFGTREIQDNSIDLDSVADATFTTGDRFDGLLSEDLADGAVENGEIALATLDSRTVADGAFTSAKVRGNAISGATFAAGSVHSNSIGNAQLRNTDMQDGIITSAKLSTTNKIEGDSLAGNSINAAKIMDDSIPGTVLQAMNADSHISDGSVNQDRLSQEVIENAHLGNDFNTDIIRDGSIRVDHFIDNALSSNHIQNGAITEAKLANNSVLPSLIGVNAINSSIIADSSLVAGNFQDGAVSASNASAGSLGAAKFEPQNIPFAKIKDSDLEWSQLGTDSLTSAHFENALIGTANIGNSQMPLNQVTSGVTGSHFNNSLTAASINTPIDGNRIADGAITTAKILDPIQDNRFQSGLGASKLADDTLTASFISDLDSTGIAESKIEADSITTEHFVPDSIDPNQKFEPGQLDTTNLPPLTAEDLDRNGRLPIPAAQSAKFSGLILDDFSSLSIPNTKMANNSVRTTNINDDLITKNHFNTDDGSYTKLFNDDGDDHADALHWHTREAISEGDCPSDFSILANSQMCVKIETSQTSVKMAFSTCSQNSHICSLREIETVCNEHGSGKYSGAFIISELLNDGMLKAEQKGSTCRFTENIGQIGFTGSDDAFVACCINN